MGKSFRASLSCCCEKLRKLKRLISKNSLSLPQSIEVKQGKNSTLGFKNRRLKHRASVERSVMRVSQSLAPDKDFIDLIEGRESKMTLL